MSAQRGFQPVLIAGGRGEVDGCPSADVLVLFGAGLPQGEDLQEELLDGWTLTTLDAHVATCPSCRALAEETGDVVATLDSAPLDDPAPGFWDDLAEGVMRTIDGDTRADRDNVIPLRLVAASPSAEPADPTLRRLAWALAAAVVFAVGLGIWLERDPAVSPATPAIATRDAATQPAESVPDPQRARAMAAELGISTDPLDLSAAAATDVPASDISLESASLAWLMDGLAAADMELLDVSLPTTDPLLDLIALDDSDLAEVLRSLES